jgi:hypothetical protein
MLRRLQFMPTNSLVGLARKKVMAQSLSDEYSASIPQKSLWDSNEKCVLALTVVRVAWPWMVKGISSMPLGRAS